MQIQNSEIDYGKLVFYSRTNKQMTQQELSIGICSITYLSKLENSKITPNMETLALLLERLDIDINEIDRNKFFIINNLEEWYKSIIQRDEPSVIDHLKEKIDLQIKNAHSTNLIYYYHLVSLRYSIHKKNKKDAEEIMEILIKGKDKFGAHQKAYFEYFLGLYYCTIKADSPRGLVHFENIIYFFNDPTHVDPEFFFHLSLTYTNTYNTPMAVTYAEKALNIFNSKLWFKRSLECQLLLGVNYGRLKEYSRAIEILNKIINVSKGFEDKVIFAKALHNLGFIHSKLHNYEEAIKYYLHALDYIDTPSKIYLNVVIELASVLIKNNQKQEALAWVNKTLSESNKYQWPSTKLVELEIIKYQLINTDSELISYLENTAIPKFVQSNDFGLMSQYYETLGKSYKKLHQYKKSSHYYELCLKLLKKMS
ncbi:tetratricopeptide repeat protein [Metabacillus arenae]|uniref:Tetratricopeptide repeat protein n=1 Tax=Metabacillus arenae TaxID=2771434 RepID=A0A926N9Y1_9BACI|nr:tetratricopeptide repeat protein [Metabacillus arenae]MBD1379484.1 tetratricopeptide repeat protein [Metabacillus arenae]